MRKRYATHCARVAMNAWFGDYSIGSFWTLWVVA
jgi:hypothetical protein